MRRVARALISVSDKTGVAEFAAGLAALRVEILSTGGTAKLLREKGVRVRDVSDLTGFPEMLDGRVKTLHPRVHGGILAIRSNAEHQKQASEHGIEFIDLVAVNLYPFEATADKVGARFEELIENIDIGGPSMIRSAAKNFTDVTVIVDTADYVPVLDEMRKNGGEVSRETRSRLARKAFAATAAYDGAISSTLQSWALEEEAAACAAAGVAPAQAGATIRRTGEAANLPENLHLNYRKVMNLRYGENPHQKAALYVNTAAGGKGLAAARQLQGKELSYNNIVDLEAAWRLVIEFAEPATAIIKHTNPCGVATGTTLAESYRRALGADPVSAFGSVIAFNRSVDSSTADELAKLFVEAVIAPGYQQDATTKLAAKKNLRLMDMSSSAGDEYGWQLKTIGGGLLAQSPDTLGAEVVAWKCVTERQPTEAEKRALEFAWRVVKHVKSNAIVYARDGVMVGVGAGQMSRVDSVRLGAMKARELNHDLAGTVVASDAFFPFPDGVEEAVRAGATAVVQPGGSVRDAEVIAAANTLGLAMVFTGVRHFRH
ncbi:MAG TPA: bifunctional phosphoribosylaminoimidazolecarboxamide formyltransferase/IMP cyclohydrolase [Terriglobia bacterium]|nr:bifunctional phosphoribosylaminoimidazolecarboxamide formyltransferase/IMP cyclohydrolase [Terriglobia bacterium]